MGGGLGGVIRPMRGLPDSAGPASTRCAEALVSAACGSLEAVRFSLNSFLDQGSARLGSGSSTRWALNTRSLGEVADRGH